ncbi:pro-melanin-concentrating hormone, like [Synchiropus splendidus]|uniref:pro-melanin-concentrating hormone, like n=1 Tax=Synchiropus splendidus TaxID=270530 RepID=UPI00237EE561|nr:pro-melanin-concentrating hormone, like [Synchiropus splendidus]
MRQSLMSLILGAALLFQCSSLSVSIPMGKTEDGLLEQEALASLLGDDATQNSLSEGDLAATGKPRRPRVIVVADPSVWKDLRMLQNGLSIYKRRAEDEHREGQDINIPILRRDTMRCMVGRVYRPCWEV